MTIQYVGLIIASLLVSMVAITGIAFDVPFPGGDKDVNSADLISVDGPFPVNDDDATVADLISLDAR